MSQLQVNRINDASGGVLAPISSVMRNRIINGAMTISQRVGTSSTSAVDGAFQLDRWKSTSFDGTAQTGKFTVQQNAGAVTPPAGFINYLGVTSSATTSLGSDAEYVMGQNIEGLNIYDLGWGTASAKTVTLSFWVRSSLTGTFGGSLRNANVTRSYPFTYTIASANTWEQKSITIEGDTTGTWLTADNIGIRLVFSLGAGSSISGTAGAWVGANRPSVTGAVSVVGTNGATFYLTGCQLEVGTQATSFEYRQYQQELALCQRYYAKLGSLGSSAFVAFGVGRFNNATSADVYIKYPVSMRSSPTVSASNVGISGATFSSLGSVFAGTDTLLLGVNCSGATTGQSALLLGNNSSSAFVDLSAEL